MSEAFEVAESIFNNSMGDYDVFEYVSEKYQERINIIRNIHNVDCSTTMLENISQNLLSICKRYLESVN